ncbi:hypothetical protein LWI29_004372 [Acer saccharum]|uniref:Uncharacterized protein n=1 Tax=Acer saccharum TaxID=4024 RepID=A0AA39S6T3_ACESA|nr:hypothetical protein LWI29_004372 [Acer saccharum]
MIPSISTNSYTNNGLRNATMCSNESPMKLAMILIGQICSRPCACRQALHNNLRLWASMGRYIQRWLGREFKLVILVLETGY